MKRGCEKSRRGPVLSAMSRKEQAVSVICVREEFYERCIMQMGEMV